jgi:hypothetical protein
MRRREQNWPRNGAEESCRFCGCIVKQTHFATRESLKGLIENWSLRIGNWQLTSGGGTQLQMTNSQ